MATRIETSTLTVEKGQVEQNRIQFEIEKLREDVFNRFPQGAFLADHSQSHHLASTESEQRFTTLRNETKKLFEQMRHIIQSQNI